MLELRLEWWSGPAMQRAGVELELSRELFVDSPAALDHFDTYRTFTTLGWIGFLASAATTVVGVVVWSSGGSPAERNTDLGVPLFVGGVVLQVVGGTLLGLGSTQIYHAVNAYNRDLCERLRRERLAEGRSTA